jgi:DNA invertase Pin-like site-specific DNA recombinase
MANPSNRRTGREYLRVSMDKSGRARSTDEQHTDNHSETERANIDLIGEPYVDVDRSASRFARKPREDFDRLLADLRADEFGADYLVLWESSRGSRKVGEWVELIDLLERHHHQVFVTAHGGKVYDPANGRDRRTLLEDAVDSEYESAKTSARIRRAMVSNAAAGRPNGRAPYGYQRRYDPATRVLVAQEPHPEHAPVVRELLERLVAGHSLHGIATDFEERGIRNLSGSPFTAQHLRSIAINPAYAGYRTHVPGRRGTRPAAGVAWGTRTRAVWPGLVDESTWLAVQRLLASPERKKYRPGRGVHLLSTISRCAVCGGPLSVRYYRKTTAQYRCRVGTCVTVDQVPLDALAERVMLGFLREPRAYEMLASAAAREHGELALVRADLAPLRAQLNDLAAALAARELSPRLAGRAEVEIQRQVDELERRERALVAPHDLQGLMEPGPDVESRWVSAPMSTKRAVASLLLTPEWLGELRVMRRPWRGAVKAAVEQRAVFWTGEDTDGQ